MPSTEHFSSFWRLGGASQGDPQLWQMLLCMHSKACASKHNWSNWSLLYAKYCSQLALERARKPIVGVLKIGRVRSRADIKPKWAAPVPQSHGDSGMVASVKSKPLAKKNRAPLHRGRDF
eukprot:scaffold48344_cov19-Tisochrysis_lutea.AAC.2